jgi:flagellar hook-associated protein 3 FlgL
MKVTNMSTYRTLLSNMDRVGSDLNQLRVTSATGKRLTRASDDPASVRPALLTRERMQGTERYLRSMDAALDRMKVQDSNLNQAENLLTRASELVVMSGNGTYGASERLALADEIKGLRESLLAVGNAQVDGKYVFSGYAETTKPFSANPAYNPPIDSRPVLYHGDQGAVRLEISPGEQVTVNLDGQTMLLGDADGDGTPDGGMVDAFAVLARIEEGLRANDQAAVTAQLPNLDSALDQMTRYRGQLGNTAQRLATSREHMADVQVDLEEILSRFEDADLAQTLTQMNQQEQALQAAMSVTARISKLSILDYL